jgi:hypothetical protein
MTAIVRPTFSIILIAALLTACDQSPSSSATPSDAALVYESVKSTSDAQYEQVEITPVTDPDVIEGARQQLVAAGYDCGSLSSLWAVKATLRENIKILKVRCADARDFQLTLFDNKGFAKPWTGTLLGE